MTATPPGDFRPTFATNRPAGNETVADAINGLLSGMRTHLSTSPPLAIATAFFNPAGFRLLADELERAGSVRLLLGAQPDVDQQARIRPLAAGRGTGAERRALSGALDDHARLLADDRNLLGFSRRVDSDARRLVAWLRGAETGGPRVEVRLYTGGFLHGKAFIVDTAMPHVISGSSNFTYAGLARNRELNLGQFDPTTVGAVRAWFEELWSESKTFDLAALYEQRRYPHPPWHVFLRMLYELYGPEVDEEKNNRTRSQLGLTTFQTDGVWRAKRLLSLRRGVIIADEVGLGKTFIAGELIHEATIERRQKVLVIAPATLRDSIWSPLLQEKNLPADVISFEELVGQQDGTGRLHDVLRQRDAYAMVIVDEAHALRNATTRRASALRNLLSGRAPKDLLLLTATPVNNSLYDLYNLISYFVPNDAAFADAGVPSLKAYFDRAMAIKPDDLSPEHLFTVIDQVAVRRTRQFVKHHYTGDKVTINGNEQEIRFPTPRVRRIEYDLDAAMPGMFDRLATALGVHVIDKHTAAEGVLLDAPGEVLSFARYVPSRFRRGDGQEAQYEVLNAGMLRSALLKRFESSAYAFRRTVEKMITSHNHFLDALASGYVLTGDALRDWTASDSDDIIQFLDSYTDDKADVGLVADYDRDALRKAVLADRDLLAELHEQVKILPWNEDPKLLALSDALARIAADAEAEAVHDQQIRDKRKIVIFSYFADTVEHLTEQVRAAVDADNRLAAYRNRIAGASGPDRRGRADVLAGFAPRTAGGPDAEDRYDILVATDVLSEGVNLQQARHILNYDLPWNPMRLVQRHGRVDRIGSEHSEVFIRCYFPDRQLEALLGLEERLQRKLKQAAAAVGVGHVLPGFAGLEVTFTETRDEIDRLRHEEAGLFEEGGLSALSGEEYRRTLERALADRNTRRAVIDLAWASGTGFARGDGSQPGYVFCARVADHPTPWFRYVPITSDYHLEHDGEGRTVVIEDILTCLSHANPPSPATPSVFDDGEHRIIYDTAFDAWEAARAHILDRWMFATDPANIVQPVPRIMREAANLVRERGSFLAERQEDLIERLEAPYALRVQRAVRDVLLRGEDSNRARVEQLLTLADQLGLTRQPTPEPLLPITPDDIHLICWTAITVAQAHRTEPDNL